MQKMKKYPTPKYFSMEPPKGKHSSTTKAPKSKRSKIKMTSGSKGA